MIAVPATTGRVARGASAIAGVLLSAVAIGADDVPLAVGPLVIGMSLDEARAAAPDFPWRDGEISAHSGKVLSIRADAAVTLGGFAHDIELAPGYYGGYRAAFTYVQSDVDADACEQLTVPLVTDLEQRYGRLSARPQFVSAGRSPMQWESRQTENGIMVLPVPGSSYPVERALPHTRVRMGKRSVMIFEEHDSLALSSVRTGRTETRQGKAVLSVESRYARDAGGAQTCTLSTTVDVPANVPDRRPITLEPSMFLERPSIGLLHHSLDGVDVPPAAIERELGCAVSPPGLVCVPQRDADYGDVWSAVADRRTVAIRLDPNLVDFDDPAWQTGALTITISPTDRQPLDFVAAPRTPLDQIGWARRPGADELRDLRDQYAAFRGTVTVVCKIQVDHSLVCAGAVAAGGTDNARLAAAVDVVRRFAPQTVLASGQPSAGAVFEFPVRFGAAEE